MSPTHLKNPTGQDAVPQFDLGLRNIRAGRLSTAYRTLISNGVASYGTDTLDKLYALTFIPMVDDPSALSEAHCIQRLSPGRLVW
jgi:hypothetical protein